MPYGSKVTSWGYWGGRRLIAVDFLDSEEAAEDASIVHYDDAFDEDYVSGLVGAGAIEGFNIWDER